MSWECIGCGKVVWDLETPPSKCPHCGDDEPPVFRQTSAAPLQKPKGRRR